MVPLKARTMIYIDRQVFKAFKHLAFEKEMTFSEAVEEAMKEYLNRHGVSVETKQVSSKRGRKPQSKTNNCDCEGG